MNKMIERFLKYVSYDTQSNEESDSCPSTVQQLEFAKILVEELKNIGIKHVDLDQNGYIIARILSNVNYNVPTVAFIAHYDTSPEMSGKNINPQIIDYKGGDIILNKEQNIVMSVTDFPELNYYKGQKIITTDGTTLLGADDKAGIVEIISAMEVIINNSDIKHGEIVIAFTPDEEIGRSINKFDVDKLNAKYGYTIDGGAMGEIEFENFNAATAKIYIQGKSIHPGYAKNKMINSINVAIELSNLLPCVERPEYTQDYEGFFHLLKIEGTVECTSMQYIIRDHDWDKFQKRKQYILNVVDFINKKHNNEIVNVDIKDQYYNMRQQIEKNKKVVDIAINAMKNLSIKPIIKPIRGGTDGAQLSYKNLPCPNIFTGGHNFHGKYEFIPVYSMKRAVELIVEIVKLWAEEENNEK